MRSREREPGSRRWSFEDAGKQAVVLRVDEAEWIGLDFGSKIE
jgi:hypothetical protein